MAINADARSFSGWCSSKQHFLAAASQNGETIRWEHWGGLPLDKRREFAFRLRAGCSFFSVVKFLGDCRAIPAKNTTSLPLRDQFVDAVAESDWTATSDRKSDHRPQWKRMPKFLLNSLMRQKASPTPPGVPPLLPLHDLMNNRQTQLLNPASSAPSASCKMHGLIVGTALLTALCLGRAQTFAADIQVIDENHRPAMKGKELDWIYGDYWLQNDRISLIIANPVSGRDANLTIRKVGAAILDLSLQGPSNDQLSAYLPTAGRYLFQDPKLIRSGKRGDAVFWECRSSRTLIPSETTALVRYELRDGDAFVTAHVIIEGKAAGMIPAYDGVRADNTFKFNSTGNTAHCADAFFRQAIGFAVPDSETAPTWKSGRPYQLKYAGSQIKSNDERVHWSVQLHPATSLLDLQAASQGKATMQTFSATPIDRKTEGFAAVNRATFAIKQAGDDSPAMEILSDDSGTAHSRLQPGTYDVTATVLGRGSSKRRITVGSTAQNIKFELPKVGGFVAHVTDQDGTLIPVKATVYRQDGDNPDFGPNSTRTFVENCVYAVSGKMIAGLEPGNYQVFFSRGPEYNMAIKEFTVTAHELREFKITLPRVIDSKGWVSSEMHSHSSPSGDNTSDQYGRVENLLCENLEFAPCTEHARISSYEPHLTAMGRQNLMATCTGMEVTGQPLPVNHQNAFPLHHHPHTQNGGGPHVHSNPVVQIERLAMWDEGSDKLVQMNHPNLHQVYGDLDLDGKPDAGFRKMLNWADVIEVHPLQTIFEDVVSNPKKLRVNQTKIFQWMQLLNQGYRIPGVVNTDAHYNHHGSGWLRNWFPSTTDDPASIDTAEMVNVAEAGHIIMSTGPYLSVKATSKAQDKIALPGDDINAKKGEVTLHISVQCPNWLDINRVQVLINGRMSPELNWTRAKHADMFGGSDDVVKFTANSPVTLKEDAHLIVATIGEGLTMEKVMGPRYGKIPPVAVSNPIFVDLDGNGFQANKDELGLPLPH